jgi:Holliday junction DNA helicase RuvA
MIAFVQGKLEAVEENSVLVEAGGLGYRIYTPIGEDLMRVGIGSSVRFYTYMNVREDAIILYGFLQKETLDLFRLLINVNGVGPKLALSMMSSMTVDQVCLAIAAEDAKSLSKVPGIGPKAAARIILDLKDKIRGYAETETAVAGTANPSYTQTSSATEAVMALVSLGYSQSEAASAVSRVAKPEMTTEEIMKQSLKYFI